MTTIQAIFKELLGPNLTSTTLIVCYIFSFIGAILFWAKHTISGIKNSDATPNKFSLSYWIQNNLLKKVATLLVNIIITFLWLRFYKDAGLNLI